MTPITVSSAVDTELKNIIASTEMQTEDYLTSMVL
jgi:hypothetical protein